MRRQSLLALLFTLALAAPGVAAAATWTVAVAGPSLRASLHDLEVGSATLDVGIGTAGAAVMLRYPALTSPIGTLLLEGRAGVEGGRGGVDATLRGSIGPLGVRLDVATGTRAPGGWALLDRGGALRPPTPEFGASAWRFDAAADVTFRPNRGLTVTLTPRFHRAEGTGWGIAGSVRRAGVIDAWDVSGRVDAATAAGGSHAAIGASIHHVPRRAPETRVGIWWAGTDGWGIDGAWTLRAANGSLEVLGGIGPRWSDRPTAHVTVAVGETHPWGAVRLSAEARSGAGVTLALTLRSVPAR